MTDSGEPLLYDSSPEANTLQRDGASRELRTAAEVSGDLVILWQYEVKPEYREEFLRHYAEDGTWASLFQVAPGYLGTELLSGTDSQNQFLTIDRWRSATDHAEFLRTHEARYLEIDKMCELLTISEKRLGDYQRVRSFVNTR